MLALVRTAGLPEPLVRSTSPGPPTAGYRIVRFTWHTPIPTILRRLRALLQN
jgi:hypothetical protein